MRLFGADSLSEFKDACCEFTKVILQLKNSYQMLVLKLSGIQKSLFDG